MKNKSKEEYRETEVGVIPIDWDVKSTKETLYIKGRIGWRGLKKDEFTLEGPYLITGVHFKKNKIDWNNCFHITEERYMESPEIMVQIGDVLFTKDGTIGKVAYIDYLPDKASLNSHLLLLRVLNTDLDSKFLFYTLQSEHFKKYIELNKSGSTLVGLSQSSFEKYKFPVPKLVEQKKIIAILSTVDEVIQKTEAIIEQTEQVKKGFMQQLLTKGIGHTKFKETEIGEIPLGWEVKELVELANSNDRYAFTGGPFGSNLKSSDYTEDGVRIIQLQNIKDGYFANDYKIYTSESKANELFSCNIYPGDIIIAKMAEPVARACIIPNYSDRYLMASDGIRLSVDKTKYITEYVTYAINAPYFRKQAVNNSTGTTRLRIGLAILRSLKILVPSIEEQKKIADILINVDRKIEKEQSKVLKLKELKEGLMQSLLTGKVRVKVDEDEVTQV
ncbi:restriction endonuclease subunit S [Bacillus cereus]|uniref:restriction endonuclease subunit S n=1 Tax=Bacillus cereus TaxID=1396 RepID=UPI0032EAC4C6